MAGPDPFNSFREPTAVALSLSASAVLTKTLGWLWPVALQLCWLGGQEGRVDPLEISCLAVSH